jgi:hypothetical protein
MRNLTLLLGLLISFLIAAVNAQPADFTLVGNSGITYVGAPTYVNVTTSANNVQILVQFVTPVISTANESFTIATSGTTKQIFFQAIVTGTVTVNVFEIGPNSAPLPLSVTLNAVLVPIKISNLISATLVRPGDSFSLDFTILGPTVVSHSLYLYATPATASKHGDYFSPSLINIPTGNSGGTFNFVANLATPNPPNPFIFTFIPSFKK